MGRRSRGKELRDVDEFTDEYDDEEEAVHQSLAAFERAQRSSDADPELEAGHCSRDKYRARDAQRRQSGTASMYGEAGEMADVGQVQLEEEASEGAEDASRDARPCIASEGEATQQSSRAKELARFRRELQATKARAARAGVPEAATDALPPENDPRKMLAELAHGMYVD